MATKEYKNKGPIFLTQAKYDAKQALGEIPAGQECRITDWEAQEKLIAGTGITIADDGKTISASGSSASWTACPLYEGFPYISGSIGTYEIRYFKDNVYYTFSAMYFDPAFTCRSCLIKEAGANKYLQVSDAYSTLDILEVDTSGNETSVLAQETGTVSTIVYYRKVA